MLERNGIACEHVYAPSLQAHTNAIVFPYMRHATLVNIKYRALPKTFWQARRETGTPIIEQ